ncbi:HEAT repeat domain-containing protein [Polyangium fumosum]|uniref:HEAT repeat domain-containing protein n=1 Tax=Polyangium fumosum TaxID=889272 RepID=A0A4U1IS24_9BACT|nr:HEAT repeat domain-containing protein [Polyangium fumosum]TKC97114.1 HEAT repeat domain-containing protein [Polyangium fumosum]
MTHAINDALPVAAYVSPAAYTPSPAKGPEAGVLSCLERRWTNLQPAVPPPFDVLVPEVGLLVSRRWTEPCEAAFDYLAQRWPEQLITLMEHGNLEPADLTFAAEIAGRTVEGSSIRRVLLKLLEHPKAVVREGAIYGLGAHLDEPVRAALRRLALYDPSNAVRAAASDALDDP